MAQSKEKIGKAKQQNKKFRPKSKTLVENKETPEVVEELTAPAKTIKAPLEIEIPEVPLDVEEKTDDEALPVEPVEAEAEEAVLDEEEIDPFGDKWEQ